MIDWIEKWYASQCNGNWEHDQTIEIESLDNPGWKVKIDFNQTGIETKDVKWQLYELSETNWVGYSIIENVYDSAGDPSKLNLLLKMFKRIIENGVLDDDFINSFITSDKS